MNFNIECVDNLFQPWFGCIKKVCQIIIVIHTSNEYMGQELCHSVTFLIEEAMALVCRAGGRRSDNKLEDELSALYFLFLPAVHILTNGLVL